MLADINKRNMENKIDWKNNLITALISIVVTVIAGGILFYVQSDKTELSYSFERIEPFDNQTEKLTIYHIQLVNSGTATIDDIEGCISLDSASIAEYKTSSQTLLKIKDSINKGKILISIKSLNKEEKCKISILAKSVNKFPNEPTVQFRAKGILGIKSEESVTKKSKKKALNDPILIIMASSIFALLSFTSIRRLRPKFTGGQDGRQKDIISYLCGVNNLKTEIERLTLMAETTYCLEADRFGYLATNSNDIDYQNKIKSILSEVITYAFSMADDSKAICYYNLAKIEKAQKNEKEADKYLQLAKGLSKYLIEKRMKIENIKK